MVTPTLADITRQFLFLGIAHTSKVNKMLCKEPSERITAAAAAEDAWQE